MVCVPCNVNTPAARLLSRYPHPPPFCGGARLSLHELFCRRGGLPALESPRRRGRRHVLHLSFDVSATGANAAPTNVNPPQPPQQRQLRSSLFPGGFRRPEIKVPTVVLRIDAVDVLRSKGAIDEAVSTGSVGIVLLQGDDSAGQLYEAACVLRSVVRDRAYFLIAERVDVSAAVGASGVVLSDQGLPVIVARNMLMNSRADSVLLPIVARDVQTAGSAITAAASEGADFLIFGIDKNNYAKILEGSIIMQNVKVPIFLDIIDCAGEGSPSDVASNLLQSDASGLVLSLDDMKMLSYDISRILSPAQAPDMRMQNEYQYTHNYNAEDEQQEKSLVAGFSKLDDKEIKLIEAERSILLEAIAVIRKAAPLMREVSLLEDAVARLDQPFMMVIVRFKDI
ncbi:hypothetical protein Taro_020061 [Colocasia esculenta]|uniref:Uncharacterized protein n=1 Tax=Colocasia esculenta TaxID=4460 RepID=A0A843V106_COLES|nr:hypothetical protein [Colocasia esculenta]